MTAAQLAAHRMAPGAPEIPAVRGTAQAALLSLLLHGVAVAAMVGLALQPEAPKGEAVFTVELTSAAIAAAGSPMAAAAEEMVETSPPEKVVQPDEPAPVEQKAEPPTEPPVQTVRPEPDVMPLSPDPAAEPAPAAMPVPEVKPKARPRPPVQAVAEAKSAAPPAVQAAQTHPETAVALQPTAQPTGQLGAETQRTVAAAAGNSDEPPVITEPRFRVPPRPPEYPPRARAMEQQGVSVVRALVDTDGTSREIRLWRSSGFDALDRAALVAVRGWRFEAARRGEQPVLAWVEIPVRFEIR